MARTDLISDVLTMIRNAGYAKKNKVDVPASKMVESVLAVLKKERYIDNYKPLGEGNEKLRIYLNSYHKDQPFISNLKRVSKPGLRIYRDKDNLPSVLGGIGMAVISTSRGLVTDKEAKEQGIGGEVICYIW